MTDTARTLAEVKALLADNTTGQISAQDMRDVVESIVDPVAGGGFPSVLTGDNEAALTMYDGGQGVCVYAANLSTVTDMEFSYADIFVVKLR